MHCNDECYLQNIVLTSEQNYHFIKHLSTIVQHYNRSIYDHLCYEIRLHSFWIQLMFLQSLLQLLLHKNLVRQRDLLCFTDVRHSRLVQSDISLKFFLLKMRSCLSHQKWCGRFQKATDKNINKKFNHPTTILLFIKQIKMKWKTYTKFSWNLSKMSRNEIVKWVD